MTQAEATRQETMDETSGKGSNGSAAKTAVRAAAVAAVSGATALAAKKAFGGGSGSDEEKEERSRRGRGNDDVLRSMVSSAWDSAKDSVLPMIEEAASHAGEYLAHSTPELIRETIVPKFIDGFEHARRSGGD